MPKEQTEGLEKGKMEVRKTLGERQRRQTTDTE
jgi:hypothetical protein